MKDNFEPSLDLLDESEGGYVDHKKDPGGATNYGITNRTYQTYLRRMKRIPKHVKYITKDEVKAIYKQMYWDVVQGDDLPYGIDYAVFDAAVNSGPKRAIKWLQRAIGGLTVDGKLGMHTMIAAKGLSEQREIEVIDRMLDLRLGFMKVARHRVTKALLWNTFGRGWQKRIDRVRKNAKEMAWMPDEDIKVRPVATVSIWELISDLIERIFGRD